MTQRVVITGMGIISPLGCDVDTFWNNLLQGKCGIGPIDRFDTAAFKVKLAAQVRDFDPLQYMDKMEAAHADLYSQYAMAAACQAIQPTRCVIATGGSAVYNEGAMEHLKTTGPVVYLHVPYDEVARRVGDVVARGVVMPAGYTFRDLYDERAALYEKYADVVVQTGGLTVNQALVATAQAVTAWLEG